MQTNKPRTYSAMGILFRFHAFPSDVMDKYCLVEAVVPSGLGAPPNHHEGETEAFFILDGEAEFTIDGQTRTAGPGSYIAVPDGAVHSFHAVGDRPARMLILNAPGHMHEKFFTETGVAVDDATTVPVEGSAPPDIAHVLAVAAASGMVILPPPH